MGGSVRWIRRWGISVGSLVLGMLVLFVFRRGLPHVGWLAGYLLLLWLLFTVLVEARAPLEARRGRLVVEAADYAIQSLYHNLLLFVLPAYYASATLDSVNAVFLLALVAAAVLTAVDPCYRAVTRAAAWAKPLLFGLSIFAALNVALPLVGVRPIGALLGSAALSGLALTPAFRRPGAVGWGAAQARGVALAVLAAMAVWIGRAAVPPAPLFLARAVAARTVIDLEPVDEVPGSVPAATVTEWGGIAAYTAVHAPAGIRQGIAHVWRHDGVVTARIPLSPVRGGGAQGFRTYSRRTDPAALSAGRYTVDVVTSSGQLIGRLRFRVTA